MSLESPGVGGQIQERVRLLSNGDSYPETLDPPPCTGQRLGAMTLRAAEFEISIY